ncbi:MAG: SRPBCC family protein [Thermoproteota archaeon]
MPTLRYEIDVNAPVEQVYNYSTDLDNQKEAWSPEIVKDAALVSGTKGEKGSMFKIKGHYAGKDEEMRMMVTEKWPNSKYETKQTEGPFKNWESVQEFEKRDDNTTHVKYTINYELPPTGKVFRMVSHRDADDKIREGAEQYIQNLKHRFESSRQ